MVRNVRHMDKYDIAQHFTAHPSVTDTSLSIDPPTEKPQKGYKVKFRTDFHSPEFSSAMLLKCVNSECWSSEYYSFHKKALAFQETHWHVLL